MKTALCVLTKDYLELLKDLENPPILEDILNLPLTLQSRETCETDADFLQLLPYAAIEVMGKGLTPRLLTYRRPVTGTEGRLHGAMSVGFGGHVDTMPSGVPLLTHLFEELKRELKEELGLTLKANGDTILGLASSSLVYDTSNDVGRHHLGIFVRLTPDDFESFDLNVEKLEISSPEVKSLGSLMTTHHEELESWSKIFVSMIVREIQ